MPHIQMGCHDFDFTNIILKSKRIGFNYVDSFEYNMFLYHKMPNILNRLRANHVCQKIKIRYCLNKTVRMFNFQHALAAI